MAVRASYEGVVATTLKRVNENNIILGEWDKFPIQNNQVIEFSYDMENKKWILENRKRILENQKKNMGEPKNGY